MIVRRSFGLATAGLAATSALFAAAAQTAQNPTPANRPPSSLANADPAALMRMVHEGGAFLMQTADMGREKATRAEVKRFGQFESSEQQALAQAMRLAGHEPVAHEFTGPKAQMMNRLRAASGREFEAAFLEAQVMGHEEALNVYAAIEARNQPPIEKAIAVLAQGHIREHLILLEGLKQA